MLKFAISGVLCFVSAYLGIAGKNYYDKRCRYLKSFDDFLFSLRDGIIYERDVYYTLSRATATPQHGGCGGVVLKKRGGGG
ncbi:MAG: hypothetical protein K2N53_04135, partial [Clostridia bacterium]|nr:hypothetical protein [Clostridia bacterium]